MNRGKGFEEGKRATFSHWPKLDTLQPRHEFRCSACQRPKLISNKRVRSLRSLSSIDSKGAL